MKQSISIHSLTVNSGSVNMALETSVAEGSQWYRMIWLSCVLSWYNCLPWANSTVFLLCYHLGYSRRYSFNQSKYYCCEVVSLWCLGSSCVTQPSCLSLAGRWLLWHVLRYHYKPGNFHLLPSCPVGPEAATQLQTTVVVALYCTVRTTICHTWFMFSLPFVKLCIVLFVSFYWPLFASVQTCTMICKHEQRC